MSNATDVFEILMREHAEMLVAFLRSSVRDSHAVDDIFQETMVVAWRRLDDFDRQRSFGKWIRGIASNLVLAHFRKAGKQAVSIEASQLDWLDSRFAAIQQQHGDTFPEKLHLLQDCIDALPQRYREAINARYEKEMSLDEMVQSLGSALQTIKKRLYRAKTQLAVCIETKLSVVGTA